jgi:DNA-binding transcriptional LysR family regulator
VTGEGICEEALLRWAKGFKRSKEGHVLSRATLVTGSHKKRMLVLFNARPRTLSSGGQRAWEVTAVNGLGIALASLPLVQNDLATGRLTCPISKPQWSAQDYLLVSEYREEDAAVRAFRSWIVNSARSVVNKNAGDPTLAPGPAE